MAGKTRADGAPDTWLPACLLQDTLWGLVSKKSKNLSFEKKASVNYKKRNQLWGWSQAGDAPAALCCDGARSPGRVRLQLQTRARSPEGPTHSPWLPRPPTPAARA